MLMIIASCSIRIEDISSSTIDVVIEANGDQTIVPFIHPHPTHMKAITIKSEDAN
jgi:hypothetical protein